MGVYALSELRHYNGFFLNFGVMFKLCGAIVSFIYKIPTFISQTRKISTLYVNNGACAYNGRYSSMPLNKIFLTNSST